MLASTICVSGCRRYHGLWRRAANPLHSSRTKHGAANMPTPELQEFFAKIQGDDEEAVEALLQALDPFLRRVIHLRLHDGRLRRAVDTTDILQSLLKDFLHPTRGRRARRKLELGPVMPLPRCRRAPTRSRRGYARNAAMRVVFPRNGNPPVPSRMSANASRIRTSPRRSAAGSMNQPVCFWT